MVATVRCEEIANEKLNHLTSDEVLKAYINIYFCTLICRLLMVSSFFFFLFFRAGWHWKHQFKVAQYWGLGES